MAYDVEQLINFQNQIGDTPIMPTGRDKLDAMKSFKEPETIDKEPETVEEVLAAMKLAKATDPEYSNKFKRQPPMPLNEGGQPDLEEQAQNVAAKGRMGDSMLMHVAPSEVRGLSSLRPVTKNPETGLPEAIVPVAAVPGIMAALGTGAAAAAPVVAAAAVPAAFGITAAGVGQAAALGYGAGAPLAGGYAALGGGTNFLGNLWSGYKALNPILQGGIKGALMSPISSMISGQEYGVEDLALGTVLGLTLGGVEMGIDELATIPSTTSKIAAKPNLTKAVADKILAEPTTTSGKIWAGAKKAATDPLFLGLSGLALASAGPEEQRGRIEDVDVIEPFDPRPTPSSREFVGPITEEDIIAGVVEGEGEEDIGLGRQLQTAKEGGIISLMGGGLSVHPAITSAGPQAVAQEVKRQGHRYPTSYFANPQQRYWTDPLVIDALSQRSDWPSSWGGAGVGGDDGGGGLPTVQEKEQVPVVPFTTNTSSFNVADRVKRIAGEPTPVPEIPAIATGAPTDVSFGPKSTAALDDLFNRFQQKQGTDEIVDLVSSALPAQQGGLLSVGRPNVFEGQVPVLGDGMDDAVKFNVVPQTPADIPNTPDMALLSSDEYVVPADVVSMLGNGSSTAGAKALDQFNSLIRKKAHGTNKQQTELDAGKELSSLG